MQNFNIIEFIKWAEETFSKSNFDSVLNHLEEEKKELIESINNNESKKDIAIEVADNIMLLLHLIYKLGFNPDDILTEKFNINKIRKWGNQNDKGYCKHIKQ